MDEQNRHSEARAEVPFRDRVARLRKLARRGLGYWKGALIVCALSTAAALGVASNIKRVYRSECTVFAKPRIRTDDRDDSSISPDQVLRQAARLKDMLTTRARLESAIKAFGLYTDTVATKTMQDAVEQMKPHVGFRSLEGAQYVLSFDGDDADTVQRVTQYLASTLIDDYAGGDLDDQRREADFLAGEEQRSLVTLEEATRALTIFLAAHPEFALEAKQAAATPFGPSPAAGIPLMPKVPRDGQYGSDPELASLYRERARLEAEARAAVAAQSAPGGAVPPAAPGKPLDDAMAQAQAEVDAAAKRVAETQADLASKSNLTEDHPDMRAARMAADAAARQLHQAKVKLASLQQIKAGAAPPLEPTSVPREIADKLRQADAHIAMRRAQLARAQAQPAGSASGDEAAPPASSGVAAVVNQETEWQRLLRAMNEGKSHHEDLKLRAERAKLALEAARSESSERMAILEPPYRPTHPSKGRGNIAVAGAAMAWLLAIAYAAIRVALSDRLMDADDVEGLGLVPVLGVVPKVKPLPPRRKGVRADAAA
jgi:hypothetical protein